MPGDVACPTCGAALDAAGAACSACAARFGPDAPTRVTRSAWPADAVTFAGGEGSRDVRPRTERPRSEGSGWLLSSDGISHGRFEPGQILGARYRIIGRLGQGGMGEVFRADDLKLGQQVALKFLPEAVDRDPVRLMQLHGEVRMARQVAHPHVCRVYDIDEVDGHTFLSMEFVDGESLASLLRRMGRVTEERAVTIARQICDGVGAAHDRGVIHRDLKPANVLIDGEGQVRVADFGLAGTAGESIRAGTPAYMAPEQLSGGAVTVASDVFALGLVLYELFTGHRAINAASIADLVALHEDGAIPAPSTLVRDLNPAIDRLIMQCVRRDPAERPRSARAIAAALPGGDPLAAALAAGHTPSPEMVAAAGSSGAISTRTAGLAVAGVAAALIVLTLAYDRVLLVNHVPLDHEPVVLADRAKQLLADIGYRDQPVAVAHGFGLSPVDHLLHQASTTTGPDRWEGLRRPWPAPIYFWYRTSPRPLVPVGADSRLGAANPPLAFSGQVTLLTDPSGRLVELHVMPPQVDPPEPAGASTDWNALFRAAGLTKEHFADAAPSWVPRMFVDERRAWTGTHPGANVPIRVEAGAYRGRPVHFAIVGPWTRPTRQEPAPVSLFDRIIASLAALVMPALIGAAALLARRNVVAGRGDQRGALQSAGVVFALQLAGWALSASHVPDTALEVQRFFEAVGAALFASAVLGVAYLALEPFVRRTFPDSLIGWSRVTTGQWRDARVGRDVLAGVAAGLLMTLLFAVHNLLPLVLGQSAPIPVARALTPLAGLREAIGVALVQTAGGFQSAMIGTAGLVVLRLALRRASLAAIVALVGYTPVVIAGMFMPGTPWLDLAVGGAITATFIAVILRLGLLASGAALATHFVLLGAPLTTDIGSWRGSSTILVVLLVAGVTFLAARTSASPRAA